MFIFSVGREKREAARASHAEVANQEDGVRGQRVNESGEEVRSEKGKPGATRRCQVDLSSEASRHLTHTRFVLTVTTTRRSPFSLFNS